MQFIGREEWKNEWKINLFQFIDSFWLGHFLENTNFFNWKRIVVGYREASWSYILLTMLRDKVCYTLASWVQLKVAYGCMF